MRPEVWNYFDYIARRTDNDLEDFNKQANAALREKKTSIFKLINFLKRCDSNMTTAVHVYRENPTCPYQFKKDSKRTDKSRMDLANKMAYIAKEISLQDYLYAQSANIEYYEYPDVNAENLETDNDSMSHFFSIGKPKSRNT